jgi:hypothetical protein
MAWITPTADNVLAEFTPTELATFTQLMGGQPLDNTTKISVIVANVISEVRGYIAAGNYTLDVDTTTIPVGLLEDSIAISRWRFLVSSPQFRAMQTEERHGLYNDAIAKLKLVAAQKFSIEPATGTQPASSMWNSENKIIMRVHPVPRPGTQYTPQDSSYANSDAPEDEGNAAA